MDMYQEIDNMARLANGVDKSEKTIGNLVDSIFAQNGVDKLDPQLVATLKDRIIAAEINGQTVTENQVVYSVNWLMSQFAAPTFAQTSDLQTRVLRNVSITLMPNLFTDKDSSGNRGLARQVNGTPSGEISPCQAVTLVLLMVHQKVSNQNFQKPPAQWDVEFIAEQRKAIPPDTGGNPAPQMLSRVDSPQTTEMRQLIYGTYRSSADQETLAQGVLDQLGILR